jgi:hypothetical protein
MVSRFTKIDLYNYFWFGSVIVHCFLQYLIDFDSFGPYSLCPKLLFVLAFLDT